MCGRYSLTVSKKLIAEEFHLQEEHLKSIGPRLNISPSEPVPVILKKKELALDFFVWGLIPSWAKDPSIGSRMFNARTETLAEKPSFKGIFRSQRCLIPADGFYEWKKEDFRKTCYHIRLKSRRPFSFAGLWSHWIGRDGGEIFSCTIITGEPNELVKSIHERMPVILPPESRGSWLDPQVTDAKSLSSLLRPYPTDEMEAELVPSPGRSRQSGFFQKENM